MPKHIELLLENSHQKSTLHRFNFVRIVFVTYVDDSSDCHVFDGWFFLWNNYDFETIFFSEVILPKVVEVIEEVQTQDWNPQDYED